MSLENKLREIVKKLPLVLANEAVNFTLDNFRKQGFQDRGLQAWAKRKRNKKDAGRAVLIMSGRLRRSIQVVQINGGHGFGSLGVPYARIHNEGGQINQAARSETFVRNRYVRGPKSKMFGGMGAFKKGTTKGRGQSYNARVINIPKRKYIGASPILKTRLINVAQEYIRARMK